MATATEIIEFVERVEEESNAELKSTYGNNSSYDPSKTFSVSFGSKYAKVVSHDSNGSSGGVWGFIEIESGDIFKAAGWSKPAKHARGNIETASYGPNYVWTGPNYLR